jgi:hypothetical protein
MMRKSRVWCCIFTVSALACSGSKAPEPQPSVSPSAAPVDEARADESTAAGVSSGFQVAASEAFRFINETLRRGATHENEAEFDADLAEARRMVSAARDAASTDADRRAALILTLLLSKDKERYQAMLLSSVHGAPYDSVQGTIQELYTQREQCAVELRGWLGQTTLSEAELAGGACLAEAEQAAAALGLAK